MLGGGGGVGRLGAREVLGNGREESPEMWEVLREEFARELSRRSSGSIKEEVGLDVGR